MSGATSLKVEGLVVGRRQDGKNYYSDAGRRQVMSLCRRGVGSVAAIAVANGLNPNVLRRWLSVDSKTPGLYGPVEVAQTLMPVIIEDRPDRESGSQGDAGTVKDADAELAVASTIEIAFERGTLRFTGCVDESLVRMVAAALGPRC